MNIQKGKIAAIITSALLLLSLALAVLVILIVAGTYLIRAVKARNTSQTDALGAIQERLEKVQVMHTYYLKESLLALKKVSNAPGQVVVASAAHESGDPPIGNRMQKIRMAKRYDGTLKQEANFFYITCFNKEDHKHRFNDDINVLDQSGNFDPWAYNEHVRMESLSGDRRSTDFETCHTQKEGSNDYCKESGKEGVTVNGQKSGTNSTDIGLDVVSPGDGKNLANSGDVFGTKSDEIPADNTATNQLGESAAKTNKAALHNACTCLPKTVFICSKCNYLSPADDAVARGLNPSCKRDCSDQ